MRQNFINKNTWRQCLLLMFVFFTSTLLAQDAVADNMLLYQRTVGGWPKHIGEEKIDYTKVLSSAEKEAIRNDSLHKDATIDNKATTKEIRYLLKAFAQTGNKEYKSAAEKGIRYLLKMQYSNGGFPQFYPDSSGYRSQITYNDNAMINALDVLWDVAYQNKEFKVVDPELIKPAQEAVAKGIDCILKTQLTVHGKLTAWCAQYNKKTLQPEKARAFELVSLSGSESVGIVSFLMKVPQPSLAIQKAVKSAVEWLQQSKIEGYEYVDISDDKQPAGKDRVVVPQPGSAIWARFYDVETGKPFFTGRDGIKKGNVAEIDVERRTGYAWYGTWPQKLLEKEYPEWLHKNGLQDAAKN